MMKCRQKSCKVVESCHWQSLQAPVVLVLLTLCLFCILQIPMVVAHPLGTFSINQLSRLNVSVEQVSLEYIVDMAEIPTLNERGSIDLDQDGTLSDQEREEYLSVKAVELKNGLQFLVNDAEVEISLTDKDLRVVEGQGGLPSMRIRLLFIYDLVDFTPGEPLRVVYRNTNFSERLGWQEIVAQGNEGVVLQDSNVPEVDISNGLQQYPQERLSTPLAVQSATFTAVALEGADTREVTGQPVSEMSTPAVAQEDEFTRLIRTRQLTTTIVMAAMAMAFLLGAFHALSPGHGKSIVAAYLVGSRGTPRHALFLGATVTLTHTIGVFALGLITLFASQYILPEQLYPWLSVLSGVIVLVIGAVMLITRLRSLSGTGAHHHHHHHHQHGHEHHSHLPLDSEKKSVTWKSLLALGISGGILPCPSALVVLLTAISMHRVGFGLILIFAFSLGLASVLTIIGLLFVKARQFADRIPTAGPVIRVLPAVSALVIMLLGAGITITAWQQAF